MGYPLAMASLNLPNVTRFQDYIRHAVLSDIGWLGTEAIRAVEIFFQFNQFFRAEIGW